MTRSSLITFFTFTCFFLYIPSLTAQEDVIKQLEEIAVAEEKVMMPMRDGIRLATNIYRPKTDKKVLIIFSRTPYNFATWQDGEKRTRTDAQALEAVKRGYAYGTK
jgi:uncharacterized protein